MKNTIKTRFRRAFTIVELVIVIAVIAALAAVLIPTFANVINAANESNDMVLVRNLNLSLTAAGTPDKVTVENKDGDEVSVYNVTTAITSVRGDGYDVSKLTPTSDSGDIVYNASTNKFIYYADDFTDLAYGDEPADTDILVVITDSTLSRSGIAESQGYYVQYCVYSTDSDVTVTNDTTDEITVWVYSENYANVTVEVPAGTIYQSGTCTYAQITCSDNSYHPIGTIKAVNMVYGRYVPEEQGNVSYIYISSSNAANVAVESIDSVKDIIYTDAENGTLTLKGSDSSTVNNIASAANDFYTAIIAGGSETSDIFADYVITTEPTCTEEGVGTYTTIFGTEVEVTLAATGHSYDIEYTNPKLSSFSITYDLVYTCTVCDENTEGHTKTETTATDGDNFGWSISTSSNVTLTGYSGTLTDIVIPDGIKTINTNVFTSNTKITSVVIPDSVTEIGEKAFSGCTSLKSVTIGSGDTDLSNAQVFSGCTALETVIISEGVKSISGGSFFATCKSISYISIPDSMEYLCSTVFENSSLLLTSNTSYQLGTTSLSNPAPFNYKDNAYYIGNETNPYVVLMGVVDKSVTSFTIQSTTKIVYSTAFKNKLTATGEFGSLSTICSKLESLEIPEGVVQLAAYYTTAASVVLPSTLKYFGTRMESSGAVPSDLTYKVHTIFYNGTEEEWNANVTLKAVPDTLRVFYYDTNENSTSNTIWYYNSDNTKTVIIQGDNSVAYDDEILMYLDNSKIYIRGGYFGVEKSDSGLDDYKLFENYVKGTSNSTLTIQGGKFLNLYKMDSGDRTYNTDDIVKFFTNETLGAYLDSNYTLTSSEEEFEVIDNTTYYDVYTYFTVTYNA